MAAPKKASLAATPVATQDPVRELLTPSRCRTFVRGKIASRLPEICDGLLRKAEDGDLAAVKTLLQMAALDKSDSKKPQSTTYIAEQLSFLRKTRAEFRQG